MTSPNNARHAIEVLLTTETCRGKYLTASEITAVPIPEIVLHDGNLDVRSKLSFPLDVNDVVAIKERAERAGVGTRDATVVNLDVAGEEISFFMHVLFSFRTSSQFVPHFIPIPSVHSIDTFIHDSVHSIWVLNIM